jgi:hypothetical protein
MRKLHEKREGAHSIIRQCTTVDLMSPCRVVTTRVRRCHSLCRHAPSCVAVIAQANSHRHPRTRAEEVHTRRTHSVHAEPHRPMTTSRDPVHRLIGWTRPVRVHATASTNEFELLEWQVRGHRPMDRRRGAWCEADEDHARAPNVPVERHHLHRTQQ